MRSQSVGVLYRLGLTLGNGASAVGEYGLSRSLEGKLGTLHLGLV